MAQQIVVTGAAGFLGGRTAKFLAGEASGYQVLATSRRSTRKDELERHGCTFVAGDLEDLRFCRQLAAGTTTIVHCAALSSPWGPHAAFYGANVTATQHLLQAALEAGVARFVLISTPSIYFNYRDRWAVAEEDPLPSPMVNHYASTKYRAEQMVLEANGRGIETIALRPRAIIGGEDAVIFPRVLEAYRQGKLKIIGNGQNVVDLTCVRNVIEAIRCCLQAPESALGTAYNITNGAPIKLWDALDYLLRNLNLTPPTQRVPQQLALWAAGFTEWRTRLLTPDKEPALTRYSVGILSQNFTLNIEKATHQLGYQPVQTTMEGIDEFIQWYQQVHPK